MDKPFSIVREQTSDYNPHMIRLGRQSRGLSISAVARAIGLTSHQLQWIEQGKMALPPDAEEPLCQALFYPSNFFLVTDGELWPVEIEETYPRPWFHMLASGMPAEVLVRRNTFVCEPFETKVWREHEEQEAAREAERKEVNRLRKRVAELETQLRDSHHS